jgi:hypothetical protein
MIIQSGNGKRTERTPVALGHSTPDICDVPVVAVVCCKMILLYTSATKMKAIALWCIDLCHRDVYKVEFVKFTVFIFRGVFAPPNYSVSIFATIIFQHHISAKIDVPH